MWISLTRLTAPQDLCRATGRRTKASGRQRNPTPRNHDSDISTPSQTRGSRVRVSGLDYPLASLAARPPARPAVGERASSAAGLATTEEPRRTNEPEPSDRNHRIWSRATAGERRRRDASATPRLRNHDSRYSDQRPPDHVASSTASEVWSRLSARFARCSTTFHVPAVRRDRRFETLAGARSSTTERAACGLDYPLASLAARPPFTSRPTRGRSAELDRRALGWLHDRHAR